MILPFNNFVGNSEGENIVWHKLNDLLSSDFISFHNYHIGLKQADVILLCPKLGILIIEIKGFHAKNIIDVPDNTIIRIKNRPPEPSPFNQAVKYRNILLSDFLNPNSINSVYVAPAVCYPFITKSEYIAKGLDKISHSRLTITSEDLTNSESLLAKINDIFDLAYSSVTVPELIKYGFDGDLMNTVGNVISPNFENTVTETIIEVTSPQLILKRDIYSRFIYIDGRTDFGEEKINALIGDWLSGAKIYFYSENSQLLGNIKEKLNAEIIRRELNIRKAFTISLSGTFLFEISETIPIGESFEIINGESFNLYKLQLNLLHKNSSFNKDQYTIEHAVLNNIIVKAGAGTGKTFSIVSRINYLIWKKDYDATDLRKAIVMITFTNESADAMKEKLMENFLNYYLLTKNPLFLELIECVEDMNISTIHSLSRKILKIFSPKLGLGCNFKIVTGDYKRKQILHKRLNDYVSTHKGFGDIINISMFHLGERLASFLERMDSKNVDIVNDSNLNFGSANNSAFDDLISVIRDTQKDMNEYCGENNSVSLGDLIRKLKVLYANLNINDKNSSNKIDFLFVDEFQDTDDVQIELMKSFQGIFGFKFFVVGDVKQCIYRFRGAQERAFDTLTSNGTKMETISLNKNYRTDTHLMDVLNTMFSRWSTNRDIEYTDDDVLMGTKNHCDKAEIYNIKYKSHQTFKKHLIYTINTFKDRLQDEKDKVAILVRYNWQIAGIRELCEQNGINVETEIGGELFKIDPTIDLYKLILALRYNNSAKYLYNLYTTSYIKDNLPKIVLWNKKDSEITSYFYENLPSKFDKWTNYLERLRSEPVLKVIRDIVDDIKPWEIFSAKVKATEIEDIERSESYYIRNLDQLFEKLVSATNTDYLTINKLSEYLEIMILTRREEEARSSYDIEKSKAKVICTTIHKSKGLEFDTVILPFCDFDISCGKAKGDVDLIYSGDEVGYRIMGENFIVAFENDLYSKYKEDEVLDRKREETRILYVALTRAIRHIIHFTNIDPACQKYRSCWDKMIKGDTK